MLQRCDPVAYTVIGQGTEIIPTGIPLGRVIQCIQRFLIATETDILIGGILIGISLLLPVLLPAAAKRIVTVSTVAAVTALGLAALISLFRVFDLLICSVDLLHFPCGFRVSGIAVRMVLLGQLPVCPLYFLIRCVPADTPVSMNMWGFTPSFLKEQENRFPKFFREDVPKNPAKAEFFLPSTVSELLKADQATVKVLRSAEKWYGVTYTADKPVVVAALKKMAAEGKYPDGLWK